ncbi:hypothetical protein PoB_005817000 [Plakobranchus ocellatus]|uniref:Uncharacterized protein n=1 Tax=Plakobranchus ocellatus TaxID=259542 RepID=A0AAV4CJA1_9GAST|nr:hypothetical protein PoB_005817000 [Plakobranchus ocellatus]
MFTSFCLDSCSRRHPRELQCGQTRKSGLNRASCSGKLICGSDLKLKLNAYIHSAWQKNWDAEGTNKFHEMLPSLSEDLHRRGEGAGRKGMTAMCRPHVAHPKLPFKK